MTAISESTFHKVRRNYKYQEEHHTYLSKTQLRTQVGKVFGISRETVRLIVLAKTWNGFLDFKNARNEKVAATKKKRSQGKPHTFTPPTPLTEEELQKRYLNKAVSNGEMKGFLKVRDRAITDVNDRQDHVVSIVSIFLTIGVLFFLGGMVAFVIALGK